MTKAPHKFDIVGSFLRPEELKEARRNFEEGRIDKEELTRIEDKLIEDLVKKEKEVGLKFFTDGEFRRSWWNLDFFWGLEGVEKVVPESGYKFHGEVTRAESAKIVGKLGGKNHPFIKHFEFLKQYEEENFTPKLTIPSPSQFFAELTRQDKNELEKIYPTSEELHDDIVKAYGEFFEEVFKSGCTELQLDDCTWIGTVDEEFITESLGLEIDSPIIEELKQTYLELNNRAIEKAPEGLNLTTHICRGNYHSDWAHQGGYDKVSDYVLAKENVSGYFLEYDDERSGSFEALKKVPKGKKVVLGLITSKNGNLEDKETIKRRIEEASKYVDKDHICLSPQCGFSSTEEGNKLTEEAQWEKLRLIREIAEEVL